MLPICYFASSISIWPSLNTASAMHPRSPRFSHETGISLILTNSWGIELAWSYLNRAFGGFYDRLFRANKIQILNVSSNVLLIYMRIITIQRLLTFFFRFFSWRLFALRYTLNVIFNEINSLYTAVPRLRFADYNSSTWLSFIRRESWVRNRSINTVAGSREDFWSLTRTWPNFLIFLSIVLKVDRIIFSLSLFKWGICQNYLIRNNIIFTSPFCIIILIWRNICYRDWLLFGQFNWCKRKSNNLQRRIRILINFLQNAWV